MADAIKAKCKDWKIRASGCADDAIFARTGSGAGSIAEEFQREGICFTPARESDRVTGWNKLRGMLAHAGQVDRPGLYIARQCEYFWATVPTLPRDPKRIEDVDSTAPVRYGILYDSPVMQPIGLVYVY